jgi:hypothetical protein
VPKLKKSAPKADKKKRMGDEMKKFSKGDLHSGAKDGPVVKNPAQAKAIGMSESGQSNNAPPPKGPSKPASSVKKKKLPRNSGRR